MKRILLYAAPFSYGPTGKALSLASHLKDLYQVELAGYNSSYDLMKLDKDLPIIHCEFSSSEPLADQTLLNYDLIISCSDLKLASRANQLGVKSIMLDSLFWWQAPNCDEILSTDAYVVQDFLGVREAISFLPQECPNLHKVGAVLRKDIDRLKDQHEREEHILINYGGLESPYVKVPRDSRYPFILTELLSSLFKERSSFKFTVTGNSKAMNILAKEYSDYKNVEFKTLQHDDFTICLAKSKLIITSPGIETFYESISLATPSVLLPPNNSTQYLQLLALINSGIENPVCHYNYYDERYKYERDLDETNQIKIVLKNLDYLYESKELRNSYLTNLYNLISSRLSPNRDIYERKKQEYIKSIGCNGGQAIVKVVNELIGS
jgi:hypothetical protein